MGKLQWKNGGRVSDCFPEIILQYLDMPSERISSFSFIPSNIQELRCYKHNVPPPTFLSPIS